MGVVSPNGIGVESFAASCRNGVSGISALPEMGEIKLRSSAAAQVRNFEPTSVMELAEVRRVPRMVPMGLAASREALAMAKIQIDPNDLARQRQIGVALGTGGGGLAFVEEQYRVLFQHGTPSLFSITAGTHGNLSSELSIQLHLRGPSHVLSTGCTSSTDAIGYATMLIRTGSMPMMLAGGADSPIAPGILNAFEKMRVISTRRWDEPSKSSRPFSADRDGFVLGEGAWMFLLEERDHAIARGANILAEILGYGSTCDAYHRVQIAPNVAEPVRAIELAIQDANAAKDDIGYINLHGTGTQMNDLMETLAVKNCFGEQAHRIPMSSVKSMIGHPQGACGAAGVAATILSMRDGVLHPTINLVNPDPQCDLDYVQNVGRPGAFDRAICNCIAFGSKNSALVIGSDV
jgi:3-oxoacyl-[acyl-carrier-protein] synthase II